MGQEKNRIAMLSPSLKAYSETFIQVQKIGVQGKVFYYYGGALPTHLENFGKLLNPKKIFFSKVKQKLGFTSFSPNELAFIGSLKQHKIQLVIAQYGDTAHRVVKICEYLNIPLITHFHGYDASVIAVINNCSNYKDVFAYSSYVIVVSISMQKRLMELRCPKEKIIYNPCSPDTSFLSINPLFKQPLFIGLGRFVEKKAPYYTILAFKQVLDKFPNAMLVLGGQGELHEVCKNLVRYFKLEEHVLLPGVLTKAEFSNYLSKGLAFVQHSVTATNGDQEGTPVAVLEASAAGLPVVSTVHAGIPDVILDGETGFLVPEHDVDAMSEKMIILLENKALSKQMGAKGKERISSYFTLEKHLKIIDELIKSTISKNE